MEKEKLRILMIGYGKMGKAIESIALKKGHSIVGIVSDKQMDVTHICKAYQPNIAFEFTSPTSAVANLKGLIDAGIPVVCGSTGWLEHWDEIGGLVAEKNSALFYASNYSMGMNLLFSLVNLAGKYLNEMPDYEIDIEEIHHIEKKDKPSGTAISIADILLKEVERKKVWALDVPSSGEIIGVSALRQEDVPGTHTVSFSSAADTIELSHTAHSRLGFASGAVMAGEWLIGKKGVFGMKDFFSERLAKFSV